MCGIVGFTGKEQAAPILLEGLSKLEYLGYDSAGIEVRDGDRDVDIIKAKGRLKILAEKTNDGKAVIGSCGIGHTRWATHGEPSEKEHGWKKNSFIRNMFGTWWRAFKSSSNFRRTFLLAFYTAMILLRTVLNREIWFDPLGKLLGGWGLYEDGQFTTESIENFMLFVPFSILLLWAFQKELLGESPENIRFGKTVWEATKAVAIFSFLIEFTQLLFHLGTLQISDLTYNTLGGAVGGVIYYLGYSRKTKEIK